MTFAIYGTGGVGGFFGGKLARNGSDVHFIARGSHLEAMKKSGLRIISTDGTWVVPPGKMTDEPREIGPVDVILFCVKSYDTETAARQLQPLIKESTIVISLQNGIDNEEKIEASINTGIVYGGVANIYSTIQSPGIISETGGPKKLIFGPLHPETPEIALLARNILSTMLDAKIVAEFSGNIRTALWKKFIFITGVGGLTALSRLTLGEILKTSETCALLEDAMKETAAVAHGLGISIEPSYIDSVFETLEKFNNETRSSLYYDLSHGKPMEIEALAGTVVRLARELGISTPIQDTIYSSLLPYHLKHVEALFTQKLQAPP